MGMIVVILNEQMKLNDKLFLSCVIQVFNTNSHKFM